MTEQNELLSTFEISWKVLKMIGNCLKLKVIDTITLNRNLLKDFP